MRDIVPRTLVLLLIIFLNQPVNRKTPPQLGSTLE